LEEAGELGEVLVEGGVRGDVTGVGGEDEGLGADEAGEGGSGEGEQAEGLEFLGEGGGEGGGGADVGDVSAEQVDLSDEVDGGHLGGLVEGSAAGSKPVLEGVLVAEGGAAFFRGRGGSGHRKFEVSSVKGEGIDRHRRGINPRLRTCKPLAGLEPWTLRLV
jgi:hypothetical protein